MALGLIETRGLLPAIEGADAMLKAADVHLLEKNLATGGLVTITVAGEVSAVQASVDAAVCSIGRIRGAELVASHVIARPDSELPNVITVLSDTGERVPAPQPEPSAEAASADEPEDAASAEPSAAEADVRTDAQTGETAAPEAGSEGGAQPQSAEVPAAPAGDAPDMEQLRTMTMPRLRELALSLDGLGMDRETVAKSTKKALIAAILGCYRQRQE